MLLRKPKLASFSTLCFLCLIFVCHLVLAQQNDPQTAIPAEKDNHLVCKPFGTCEPCPHDALGQPFCKPFGNRRLVHCVNDTISDPDSPVTAPDHTSSQHAKGEILAWESCGRIVSQERADFYEFVACNVLFAVVALSVLFMRSKHLQAMQARQLAARIGLVRGGRR